MAGEQLTYSVTIVDIGPGGSRVSGQAHSSGELVAEAEIMFGHMTADQLPPGVPDAQFVFTGELARLIQTAGSGDK